MAKRIKVYRVRKDSGDKVIARDTEVWIGIDDHKSSMHVTVLDSQDLVFRTSLPALRRSPEMTRGLLVRNDPPAITRPIVGSLPPRRRARWRRSVRVRSVVGGSNHTLGREFANGLPAAAVAQGKRVRGIHYTAVHGANSKRR